MDIFIGSSKEQVDLLEEIAVWVEEAKHNPLPWKTLGIFPPGEQSFHTLISISERVQGAIFVFSADDSSWYRDNSVKTTRDNVLLEYGLFTGALGVRKAVICLHGDPKRPSDLEGVNVINISDDSQHKAKREIKKWLSELAEAQVKEASQKGIDDLLKEKGDSQKLAGKNAPSCCEGQSLLSEGEEEILQIFMEYGECDDFSLTCSEIKSHLTNKQALSANQQLDIHLTKLKVRRFISREEGRKRAYFITDKGWQWISKSRD